jgi:hypothetical protein
MIKFCKHFINNLLTFRALYLLNIYEKMKLIKKTLNLRKFLYNCLIMLIKTLFYNINLKVLKLSYII